MNKVAICGSGVTGLLLAHTLADLDIKVTIFTAEAPKVTPVNAVMSHAVNASTYNLLAKIDGFATVPKFLINDMQVVDQQHDYLWQFNAAKVNQPAINYIISVDKLLLWLFNKCRQHKLIDFSFGKLTAPLSLHQDKVVVTDAQSISHEFSWLFAADGSNSWVRSQLTDIKVDSTDHQQQAIIANLELTTNFTNTAWQKFLPSGPLALLQKGPQTAAMIWSINNKELLQVKSIGLVASLQDAVIDNFTNIKVLGQEQIRPLFSQYANKLYAHRVLLVGDAARTILPLFGQGANLGGLDIWAISKLITEYGLANNVLARKYHSLRYYDGMYLGRLAALINTHTTNKQQQLAQLRGLVGYYSSQLCAPWLMDYALGNRSFVANNDARFYWPSY